MAHSGGIKNYKSHIKVCSNLVKTVKLSYSSTRADRNGKMKYFRVKMKTRQTRNHQPRLWILYLGRFSEVILKITAVTAGAVGS